MSKSGFGDITQKYFDLMVGNKVGFSGVLGNINVLPASKEELKRVMIRDVIFSNIYMSKEFSAMYAFLYGLLAYFVSSEDFEKYSKIWDLYEKNKDLFVDNDTFEEYLNYIKPLVQEDIKLKQQMVDFIDNLIKITSKT